MTGTDFEKLIEAEEYDALPRLNIFGCHSVIYSTNDLIIKNQFKNPASIKTIFKPWFMHKPLIIVCAISLTCIIAYGLLTSKNVTAFGYIITITILLLLIGGLYCIVTDKNNFYAIFLTDKGIKVGDKTYCWKDIYQTYIVRRPVNRGRYFLIIALKTGMLERYDLTNIMGLTETEKKLATSIEYFRHNYA